MISIRADVVIKVLDGFTGQPPQSSALRWELDGQVCRPVVKRDGYCVLINLAPGVHTLVIRGGVYQEERLEMECGGGSQELLVTMKPGKGYPFGQAVTWLTLALQKKDKTPLAGQRIWIAVKNQQTMLRVAQDVIPAGEREGRLFCPETAKTLSLPRDFLLLDGPRSELCRVESLESGRFAQPTAFEHKRSCCLCPAQSYTTDQSGRVQAVFREPVPLEILAEGHPALFPLELEPGENSCTLTITPAGRSEKRGK